MARALRINVQIDQLPDILGDPKSYVGARLSAWIGVGDTDQAESSDLHMLLPWEWTTADTIGVGNWDPGQKASWTAWWIDPADPASAVDALVTPVINPDARHPAPDGWREPRDLMLAELARDHRRLEAPGASQADQTVFGFVESLSSFPAPWPELHKVWTCLRVDTAQPSAASELVVVPVFGVDGPSVAQATYKDPAKPQLVNSASGHHLWTCDYAAVTAPGIPGSAVVDRLAEAPYVGARILLKDKFLIGGARGWASVTSQDWMVQLPAQIAEILDPMKGFTQGLEQALIECAIANGTPPDQRSPAQIALLNAAPDTHARRSALRLLLAAAYWRVLAPAATGTRAATPLPLAYARAHPSNDNQNFLAGLTARDAARDPASLDATIPGFMTGEKLQIWTDERLQGLLGSEKEPPAETNDPVVDTPAGLRAFLLNHWQNSAAAAATLTATPTPLMRFTATGWSGGHIVTDPDGAFGLFDLSGLAAPHGSDASISFTMTTTQANAVVVADLFFDGYANSIATIQTDPIATIGSHTLTLIVAPAPDTPAVVALPPPGAGAGPPPPPPPPPQPSFQISIDGGAAKTQTFNFDKTSLPNRRASITLKLPAGAPQAMISAQRVSQDVVNGLLAALPEAALRANATLLHAAPFISSIVAGNMHDGTAAGTTSSVPTEKIALALADWAEYRLGAECDEAIRVVEALAATAASPISAGDVTMVEPLFQKARDIAIANAKGKAANLFAALVSNAAGYALSAKANPVVFPIDQPQPISGTEDIWLMFAGIGVLVGTSGNPDSWPADNIWYSLNLASMYAPPVDSATNIRAPLKGLDPVRPEPFDPVPLQVGEIGGVRSANLSYENRSLVGEMPHDPVHTAPKSARAVPRRIEAYGFPYNRNGITPKLPALCFGKRYFFLPYLIGHGGALAPYLRDPANVTVATKMRPKNSVAGPGGTPVPGSRLTFASDDLDHYLAGLIDNTTGQPVTHEDLVRHTDYQRTTPVGTPRIDGEKELPGIPEGVEALASEIPIQPVAITLAASETAFFYRNQDRSDGVLDFTSADPVQRVIQIDLAGLPKGDNQSSKPKKLQISVTARDGKRLDPITITEHDWNDASLGVRIIAGIYGVEIFSQAQPTDIFVERPPRFGTARTVDATAVDFSNWQAFSVAVSNVSTSDATLIPPVVSIGTRQESDHQLSDPRPTPLPEMGQQKRVVTVLDGITQSPTVLGSVTIRVRRPAVEFSTYERWINWDLGDQDVQRALDAAHWMLVLDKPADDLTMDDPAVERVVVELVELFPNPEWRDRAPLAASWSAKSALIKGFGPDRSADPKLTVRVAAAAAMSKNADGTAREITLAPGGVYEIRLYGAVPEDKQDFAASLPATVDRFGKGAWQGLRKVVISGKTYRLGSPLVRTFEVATDQLPDLYDVNPMSINRMTALSGSGDRAQIGLSHDFVLKAYPKVRYVNQLSLLSQRWGWRGRPLGTMPAPQSFGTGTVVAPRPVPGFDLAVADQGLRLADGAVKDFESIAFTGRRDNDIGLVEEMKLQLAHVLPPVNSDGNILSAPLDNRAPVFVKELLYRGGANWWRFALQATSRYAAIKPGQALVNYSHVDPRTKLDVRWHSLVVRDRDTGRKLKRPGLMLVLPLTETVMSDVAVPPLLAIFSEPMFADFHIGDGLEAALDYARHPLPDAPIVWTGVERDAQKLAGEITQAYADFAATPKDTTKRQKLRLAVATFNAFARAQGLRLAEASLAKAQDEVTRTTAAVDTFPRPVPPAQQADYQIAQDAKALADKRSVNANKALTKAKADASTAEQLLQSVQAGGNEDLPNLQSEMQRFWPQIGPDPILTDKGHSGRPIPLRLDGPIGYTFDLETEAPHFGRSGFLTTPISGQNEIANDLKVAGLANIKILSWTMARLRFRRLEATELSLSKPVPVSDGGTSAKLLLSSEAIDYTKAETAPVPAEYHEGLVIDFPELDESGAGAAISVVKGTVTSDPAPLWSQRFIRVVATVKPDALSIFLNSDLGPAGTYDVGLKPTSRIWLRLVLSQREKPERSEKPYEPVLDISVRLLIDDGDGDGLARSQAGAWVTVACLPLLAGGKLFRPSDPVYVNVTEDAKSLPATSANVAKATGVRLTPFTAPVWCQFTQDVSTFEVRTVADPETSQICPVAKLTATLDAKNVPQLTFAADDAGQPQPLKSVTWLAPDPTSQIRCTVAAVVTEFISDAFDRIRERPLAVYRIEDGASGTDGKMGPVTMKLIWPANATAVSDIAAAKLRGARVRLMSLMHLQLDPTQSANPPASLIDYFSEPFDSEINMDAPDAPGRILGISKPIEVPLKK
jgi:hypothetical protein